MIDRSNHIAFLDANPDGLHLIPKDERTYDVCLYAVRKEGFNFYEVPSRYRTYEMCLEAIRNSSGIIIGVVPDRHRTYELCLIACGKLGQCLEFVPQEHLVGESGFQLYRTALASGDLNALYHIPQNVFEDLKDEFPNIFS